jgi:hypothetical protein
VLWIVTLAVAVAGLALLAVLASNLRRELGPAVVAVDRFGREHRMALTAAIRHLRDDTGLVQQKLSGK